ncbi:MAG TPA: glycosyltransferase [Thermoanaerobaculia bacterium]|nr:glycosyltransferase [Thermoanaerobaculia bacterium]
MACFDVVIPARNEAPTVAGVVRAACATPEVGSVVVVDDGSTDDTAAVAAAAGAQVIRARAPAEAGGDKGRALACGVAATRSPLLVFFDADITGAEPRHFTALAGPVLAGQAALSCGMVDHGRLRNPWFLRLPPITGLRALGRQVFEAIAAQDRRGFRIEIMINEVVARARLPSTIRVLSGLRHRSKIDKAGWRAGALAHLGMYAELLGCLRSVPLWTYGAYLRHLTVLPPLGGRSGGFAGGLPERTHPLS